jgi:hypothetical protein
MSPVTASALTSSASTASSVAPQALKSVTLAINAAITALRFSLANALALGNMSLVMFVLPACWRMALAPATWVYWGTLRPAICNGMYRSR